MSTQTYATHRHNPQLTGITVRERSFEQTLKTEFPKIHVEARKLGYYSVPQEQQVAEDILNRGKAVDAIVALSHISTRGAFYAHFIRFLFPPEFGFLVATNILVYNFVGGRGHFVGPIVGATFLSLLSEPFRGSAYETIFFSIAMLLTILFLPGGLITLPAKLAELKSWRATAAPTPSPAA